MIHNIGLCHLIADDGILICVCIPEIPIFHQTLDMDSGILHLHTAKIKTLFLIAGLDIQILIHDLNRIHRKIFCTAVQHPDILRMSQSIHKIALNKSERTKNASLWRLDLLFLSSCHVKYMDRLCFIGTLALQPRQAGPVTADGAGLLSQSICYHHILLTGQIDPVNSAILVDIKHTILVKIAEPFNILTDFIIRTAGICKKALRHCPIFAVTVKPKSLIPLMVTPVHITVNQKLYGSIICYI